jgi:hypothetical protein
VLCCDSSSSRASACIVGQVASCSSATGDSTSQQVQPVSERWLTGECVAGGPILEFYNQQHWRNCSYASPLPGHSSCKRGYVGLIKHNVCAASPPARGICPGHITGSWGCGLGEGRGWWSQPVATAARGAFVELMDGYGNVLVAEVLVADEHVRVSVAAA